MPTASTNYELVEVEVKLDGQTTGIPMIPQPNNQHPVDFPPHGETTTVIYVYK